MQQSKKRSCKDTRIAILMINSPNIPNYAHKAAVVNYMYASKHGYAFLVERCPSKSSGFELPDTNEYLMVWTKPHLVKKHLPYYDYLLYVDSDAIVVDREKRIEELVSTHMAGGPVCMVAGRDCLSSSIETCTGHEGELNAGVILFKNDPRTMDVLDAWIDARLNKDCLKWRDEFPYEQACINHLRNNRFQREIKVIPTQEMNGVDGRWIMHYMAQTEEIRDAAMVAELRKLFDFLVTSPPSSTKKEDRELERKDGEDVVEGFTDGNSGPGLWWWLVVVGLIIVVCVAVVFSLPKAI